MLPFTITETLLMFFIYGFIGWIVEVIYYGITEGKFINRGFLNGAICPVYGIGFYCVIWLFRPYLNSFPILFFGSAAVCTIVELIAGALLYAIFHLRWWDYSEYKFNLHGFICLRFSIYWGIACSLGMYMLHPAVMAFIHWMSPLARQILLLILIINTVVDIIVTVTAIVGFNKKVKILSDVSDVYRMPSEKIGSSIYGTVDAVVKNTAPALQMTQSDYKEFTDVYAAHRKAERELAKNNRAEERALIMKYANEGKQEFARVADSGKEGLKKQSRAAVAMTKKTVRKAKKFLPEASLALRIRSNINDVNADSVRVLQQHYADVLGKEVDDKVVETVPEDEPKAV